MAAGVTVHFYASRTGRAPVLDWLIGLSEDEFVEVVAAFGALVQFGPRLPMPTARPLGDGLYELRAHHGRVQLRVVYFFYSGGVAILAAGFVKQSATVLGRELQNVRRRRRELEDDPEAHRVVLTTDEVVGLREQRRRKHR